MGTSNIQTDTAATVIYWQVSAFWIGFRLEVVKANEVLSGFLFVYFAKKNCLRKEVAKQSQRASR
jgi:hypothetical protein